MSYSVPHKTSGIARPSAAAGWISINMVKTLSALLALPIALFTLFEKIPFWIRAPLAGITLLGCCLYIIKAKSPLTVVDPGGRSIYRDLFPIPLRFAAWVLIFLDVACMGAYLLHSLAVTLYTPQIYEFHPGRVQASDQVEFIGAGFPKDPAALRILFGEVEAEPIELRGQTVKVTTPIGATQPVRMVVSTGWPRPFNEFETTVPIEVLGQTVTFLAEPPVTNGRVIEIRFSLINTSDERQVTITSLSLMVVESLHTIRSYRDHKTMLGSFRVTLPGGARTALRDGSTPLLGDSDVFKLPPGQSDSFRLSIEAPDEEHGIRFDFTFFANYFTDLGLRSTVFCDQTFHAICSDLKGCTVHTENHNVRMARRQAR